MPEIKELTTKLNIDIEPNIVGKFKSRKFLTMLLGNIVGIVFALLSLFLAPETFDTVERLVSILAPLIINLAVSLGYLSAEGKADALDIVRRISEAHNGLKPDVSAGGAAGEVRDLSDDLRKRVTEQITNPKPGAPSSL